MSVKRKSIYTEVLLDVEGEEPVTGARHDLEAVVIEAHTVKIIVIDGVLDLVYVIGNVVVKVNGQVLKKQGITTFDVDELAKAPEWLNLAVFGMTVARDTK